MNKIVTITFSPCIDKSFSVSEFIPDKKLRCGHVKLEPGGGGINVARALIKLGGQALAIYPSGGYTGKHLERLMANEGVPSLANTTQNETRENIIVLEESTNRQYRFGMPGTILLPHELDSLLNSLEGIQQISYLVVSGSIPPGIPDNIFSRIAQVAKNKGCRLIIDTSGPALQHAVEAGVYLLKPNLGELGHLVNKQYLEEGEIAPAARSVINKGKAQVIVVSMGEKGVRLITSELDETIRAPVVERKSTVGAGDSMVAGLVYSLSSGDDLAAALLYGVACGTAATMSPGTELCRKENVELIMHAIRDGSAV